MVNLDVVDQNLIKTQYIWYIFGKTMVATNNESNPIYLVLLFSFIPKLDEF